MKNDSSLDKIAQDILQRQSQMFGMRAQWESLWFQIDQKVTPSPNRWFGNKPPVGAKWNMNLFDSKASLALTKFMAILENILTPRDIEWHKLMTNSEELTDNVEAQRYLDKVNQILFKMRYNPHANFSSQIDEVYASLGKYGTGCLYVHDEPGVGIKYKSIHLSELFISENHFGIVDYVHRKFDYTARQAVEMFGHENLPDQITKNLAKADTYLDKFTFIHCVMPNPDYDEDRPSINNYKFLSYYVCDMTQEVVMEGGYHSMPFLVSRYYTESCEIYGRGPATFALPDIQTLNEMKKTIIRQANLAVDPPIMISEDGALSSFNLQPGALNYGYLDATGNPLAQPFKTGADFNVAELMLTDSKDIIEDSFMVKIILALSDRPANMTATEVMQRVQEKGMLLAPAMGRQQSELLGPLIDRELDIAARAGLLPPMPDVMKEYYNGDDFKIIYQSELARSQQLGDAKAIVDTMGIVAQMAQMDPSSMQVFDSNKAIRRVAEIYGVPADCIRSVEEVQAIQAEQQKQAQMQQMAQAAPGVAKAAKDGVEAANMAKESGMGQSIVPGM